jgi:hypothetical protein
MGADCDSESRRKRAYVAALKRRNVKIDRRPGVHARGSPKVLMFYFATKHWQPPAITTAVVHTGRITETINSGIVAGYSSLVSSWSASSWKARRCAHRQMTALLLRLRATRTLWSQNLVLQGPRPYAHLL